MNNNVRELLQVVTVEEGGSLEEEARLLWLRQAKQYAHYARATIEIEFRSEVAQTLLDAYMSISKNLEETNAVDWSIKALHIG